MASIIKKKIRGQIYYYAVESKRVNGKPRIVWQKYLGKVNDIIQAVSGPEALPEPKSVKVYNFGAEAALLGMARRLGAEEIINRRAGWRGDGPTLGGRLLINTIACCAAPGAKVSDWFERTALRRHFKISPRLLTEKRLLEGAELLSEEVLAGIQRELAERIFEEFSMGPGGLIYYDIKLPGFFESKRKGEVTVPVFAMLVTSDSNVPLFYKVCPTELLDESAVLETAEMLADGYCRMGFSRRDVTLVKHTFSDPEKVFKAPDQKDYKILGLLNPVEHEELLNVSKDRFHLLKLEWPDKVKVYRSHRKLFDTNSVVLIACIGKELLCRTREQKISVPGYESNLSLIFTDNTHWENEEVYSAYAGRFVIEEILGGMKTRSGPGGGLARQNDIRFKVNTFCCFLALMLLSLLKRELNRYGIKRDVGDILKILSEMREVAVFFSKEDIRLRKKEYVITTDLDPVQKEIYDCLRLDQLKADGGSDGT